MPKVLPVAVLPETVLDMRCRRFSVAALMAACVTVRVNVRVNEEVVAV